MSEENGKSEVMEHYRAVFADRAARLERCQAKIQQALAEEFCILIARDGPNGPVPGVQALDLDPDEQPAET